MMRRAPGRSRCRASRSGGRYLRRVSSNQEASCELNQKKTARIAGVLYLVNAVTGFFSIIYVPSKLFVSGDAAATARNILASERLYRLGIACEVICAVEFIYLLWVLYRLLSRVSKTHAWLMVTFGVTFGPDYVHECSKRDRGSDAVARLRIPAAV